MNDTVVYALNNLYVQSTFAKSAVVFGAELLPYAILLFLAGWVYFSKNKSQRIRDVVMMLFVAFVAVSIADYIKYWIGAPRPFVVLENITPLFERDPFGSFPSSHVSFFAALATAAFFKDTFLFGALFCATLIIGVSRVFAGVHFPSDIFAGLLLGVCVACGISFLEKKYYQKYSLKNRLQFWK
jgi:undecaprenyl-diphosphatase